MTAALHLGVSLSAAAAEVYREAWTVELLHLVASVSLLIQVAAAEEVVVEAVIRAAAEEVADAVIQAAVEEGVEAVIQAEDDEGVDALIDGAAEESGLTSVEEEEAVLRHLEVCLNPIGSVHMN